MDSAGSGKKKTEKVARLNTVNEQQRNAEGERSPTCESLALPREAASVPRRNHIRDLILEVHSKRVSPKNEESTHTVASRVPAHMTQTRSKGREPSAESFCHRVFRFALFFCVKWKTPPQLGAIFLPIDYAMYYVSAPLSFRHYVGAKHKQTFKRSSCSSDGGSA